MQTHLKQKPAFTLIELLVVLAILALLAVMLLPALAVSTAKVQRVNCTNNLKQLGFAIQAWENSNGGKYPMAVSLAAGGASEYLDHSSGGASPNFALTYCPGMAFMVLSNELSSALLLRCPADNIHNTITNFAYPTLLGVTTPVNHAPASAPSSISAISYFVGSDATEADPQSILAGDCNIGTIYATGNQPAAWRFGNTSVTTPTSNPGMSALAMAITTTAVSTAAAGEWAWTAGDLHQSNGNLLIADGGVQTATVAGLKTYLQNATSRVIFPAVNFIW